MWKTSTIDEICNVEYGTRVVRRKDSGTVYPVYGGGGETFFLDKKNRQDRVVISRFAMSEQCTRFVKGKFFLNDSGLTLSPKTNDLSQELLDKIIISLNSVIYQVGRGTAQRNLDMKKFRLLTITYPTLLSEQQRIIAKLDATFAKIDNAMAITETNIINANIFFLNYLDKILRSENKDWDENNLKELTTKIGSGSTPRGGKESYKSSGTSLIRSMNIYDKGFLYNKLAFIDDKQAKKLNIVNIEKDDVLINITGASVARCCIVPNDVLPARVNQHVSILRTKKNILNPKLLHFTLISPYHKNKLLKVGEDGGATRQAITKNQLEEYVIRFPKNYNLQSELVKKIIDSQTLSLKMKSIYENKLKNFIQLKQSIVTQELNSELKKAS